VNNKLIWAASLFFLAFLACFIYVNNNVADNAYVPQDLIRFHVVANSDTPADQQLKREIRDAILEEIGEEFSRTETVDEARKLVQAKLSAIENIARREVLSHGKDYPVKAELGYFEFPTKTYGSFSLPAGRYEAVRVVIGSGNGENWWCVLFPPLCFVDISNNVATEPQVTRVSKEAGPPNYENRYKEGEGRPKVEVKFKLLEMLDRTTGFMAESKLNKDRF